jgi:hypothetical protein
VRHADAVTIVLEKRHCSNEGFTGKRLCGGVPSN